MNRSLSYSIRCIFSLLGKRTTRIPSTIAAAAADTRSSFVHHRHQQFQTFSSQNKPRKHPYQNAKNFLKKIKSSGSNAAVAVQRVEEIFLDLLKEEKNHPEDGPLALDLLNAALKNANLPNERIIPRIFSLACQVMVRSGHPLALKEVKRQVYRLLDGHYEFLTDDIPYNTHHVNDACCQFIYQALERKKGRIDFETSRELTRLIKYMKQLYKNPSVSFVASPEALNAFIMYSCNSGKPKKAYKEIQSMIDGSGNQKVKLEPRLSSFSLIITGFAKSGEPEKSMEIIQWMLSSYKAEGSLIPPPNRTCFNGLLHAWARSGRKDAGQRAEQTLEWMQQLHETENLDTKPDEISFASCINAWARSPGSDSPLRAESILRQMISRYNSGSNGMKPTLSAFSSVMDAWARSDSDDAPAKAEAILQTLEEMSPEWDNFQLTAIPYTILIKVWEGVARRAKGRKKIEYGDRVLQVISRMEANGINSPAPTHNAVITALLEISAVHGVLYFLDLEERFQNGLVELDTRTFNCGLNAIASMNKPDAAAKAMGILHRMTSYAEKDSSVRPDELTFNIILKVLSRSPAKDAALKADNLLQEMSSMQSVKPTFISYLTCIIAWGRSSDTEKFQRVQNLLTQFETSLNRKNKLAGKVPVAVYNAALSVCHHNESAELQSQALETAVFTMQKLRRNKVQPDETTYESFFRVITGFPDEEERRSRDELFESEFSNCINDGLVSIKILDMIQKASPDIIRKFSAVDEEVASKPGAIPSKWSRKINR